jgi:FtsZ-binding cell division protein ZapB
MPHYFFNLLFGDRLSQDEEGVELRDRAAAREEAFAVMRELSDPALGGNPRRWAGWVLQVADEAGPFVRAPLGHPALEIVTEDWQRASKRPAASQALQRQPPRKQPMSKKVSAIVDQMLACRAKAEELREKNRQLRDEIANIALKNSEIRERARFLITSAQRMDWALDPDRRRPAKHVAGGELKDSKDQ